MDNGHPLHSLIPLADFKALLGIDDREDSLSRYCLITATYTVEQYCKRRLLYRKYTDYLTFTGEYLFSLREYPVQRVLTIHAATTALYGKPLFGPDNLVDPKHYYCLPDEGIHGRKWGIRVRYVAGYSVEKISADLEHEPIRGRRIGNVRGNKNGNIWKLPCQRTYSHGLTGKSYIGRDCQPGGTDGEEVCSAETPRNRGRLKDRIENPTFL